MIINGDLKFHTLGNGELQNAVMENMTTAVRTAATAASVKGQLVFDITLNEYFYSTGGAWVAFGSGSALTSLQDEVDAIELASGVFDTDGTWDGTTVDGALSTVTASTTLLDTLTQLDTAIANAAGIDTLPELTDVVATATSGSSDGDILAFDGTNWDSTAFTGLATGQLLQWNGTVWTNVSATTIGEFGFKNINVDNGSAVVADVLADTLSLVTLSNGGVRTSSDVGNDEVRFSLAPMALTAFVGTVDGADSIIINNGADGQFALPTRVPLSTVFNDMDVVSGVSGTGMIVRTGQDAYNTRSITADATSNGKGLSVANGDGILGHPTISIDFSVPATDTGSIATTSLFMFNDGVATKTITEQNLRDNIVGANGGIPLFDLSDAAEGAQAVADNDFLVYDTGPAKWVNMVGVDARAALSVYSTAQSDANFVDVAGDTMTGVLNMGSQLISSLAAPVSDTDASTKGYVDSKVAGLTWKNSVLGATVVNIALTGSVIVDSTVVPVTDDRILVRAQTDASENGIYVVDTTAAWTRAEDFDEVSPIDEINSAAVFVEQGNTLADTGWTVTSNVVTLDTDDIIFTQFNGASGVSAGVGLVKTGNTLDVNMGAGVIALPTDEVGLDIFADGGLRLSDTVSGAASVLTGAKLRVLLDGTTISMSGTGVKVADAGITETQLNASVAGDGLQGGAGTALSLDLVAASGLAITSNELDLVAVPNSALANSALTIAADSGTSEVADLGETITIAGGTGIDTVVSATNTVTAALNAGINLLTDVDTSTTAPVANDTLVWDGSNWKPGNSVNSSSDLSDVTAVSTVAGQVLVSDGTNYTPRQFQYVDTIAVAATTWTVTHSLNQRFVNVTIYDSTNSVIIPSTIVATSTTVTTVTFSTAITGTAVITGAYGLAAV